MLRQAVSLLLAVCVQRPRKIRSGDASRPRITGLASLVRSLSIYQLVCASTWRFFVFVLRILRLSR